MLYMRTVDEIINAALINTKERIKNRVPPIKGKYSYKNNLKSRKNKK